MSFILNHLSFDMGLREMANMVYHRFWETDIMKLFYSWGTVLEVNYWKEEMGLNDDLENSNMQGKSKVLLHSVIESAILYT